MARDPESIERDIVKAREELASALDSLAVRANPQRIADDVKASALEIVNRPPVKYTLIGLGVVVGTLVLRKLFKR